MNQPLPALPEGVVPVRETAPHGDVPLHSHPGWTERFPWLAQGTTGRGDGEPFDLGLFGASPVGATAARWRALRQAAGLSRAVHARQVHAATILRHDRFAPGLLIADDADGHITDQPGLLLTASVADCVPVFLVAPRARAIALLHAGWRGAAAGILQAGLERMRLEHSAEPTELEAHLGPAICGECYEVGGEVTRALGLGETGTARLDLRAALAQRAIQLGIPAAAITVSSHCTRCGVRRFFSHRGGDPQRQMAVLGVRQAPTFE
jgi:polyphenol oxidase